MAIVIVISLLSGSISNSYAGFVIVTDKNMSFIVSTVASARQNTCVRKQDPAISIRDGFNSKFVTNDGEGKHKRSSWQAFVSLGSSLTGFILILAGLAASSVVVTTGATILLALGALLGLAGLIFGITGMRHREKRKFRGFAIAGMIIGCIDLFLLLELFALGAFN